MNHTLLLMASMLTAFIARADPVPSALIISAGSSKVGCGGFENRAKYQTTIIDAAKAAEEARRIRSQLKDSGLYPCESIVKRGQSYAVAEVKKAVNGCKWSTIMWEISDGNNAETVLERKIQAEPGVVGHTIVESKFLATTKDAVK